MNRDDLPNPQAAGLRLRCIKVLTDIDEESLRIVDSVLGRLVPTASTPRTKRRSKDAGGTAAAPGADTTGGAE